jgi:hypothetical protein
MLLHKWPSALRCEFHLNCFENGKCPVRIWSRILLRRTAAPDQSAVAVIPHPSTRHTAGQATVLPPARGTHVKTPKTQPPPSTLPYPAAAPAADYGPCATVTRTPPESRVLPSFHTRDLHPPPILRSLVAVDLCPTSRQTSPQFLPLRYKYPSSVVSRHPAAH